MRCSSPEFHLLIWRAIYSRSIWSSPRALGRAEVDQILPEASAEETPGTGADRGGQGGVPAALEGDDALIDASEISVGEPILWPFSD